METTDSPPNEDPNEDLNLCRYCRALLERERPADLVADPETLDGVMESYTDPDNPYWSRGILSTEAVSKTASRGCMICIQVLGDAINRPTTATDLAKEPPLRKRGSTPLEVPSSDQPLGPLDFDKLTDDYDENSDNWFEDLQLFPLGCELGLTIVPEEDLGNTAPIHDNTASGPTFSNIMGWLDCCLNSHAKCCANRDTNPGYFPKQVDNEEDWLVESAAMVNIYSNSYCNIAAAHARNGSEGCFVGRNSNAIKSLTVSMGFIEEWDVPTSYFTIPRWKPYSSPLTRRAWVCQELYIAPRVLYFDADQVYWRCLSLSANESFPRGYPFGGLSRMLMMSLDPEDHSDIPLSAAPELKGFRLWEGILQHYSGCDLTFATDNLVAISGLAKRLQPLTGSRYLARL
ncbi:hypothetical protein V8F33_013429 [Rhypophila sp. PSN 637]